MPNINDIAKFKTDLRDVAHENKITAGWGERVYDELPLPKTTEVPDIDLDSLLSEAGMAVSHTGDTDPSPSVTAAPVEEASAAAASVAGAPFEEAHPAAEAEQQEVPASDVFDTVPVADAYPVDDNGLSDSSNFDNFDDFLSSINFDSPSPDIAEQSTTGENSPDSTIPPVAEDIFPDATASSVMEEPFSDKADMHEQADVQDDPSFSDAGLGDFDFSGIDSDIFNESEKPSAQADSTSSGIEEPLDTVELSTPSSPSDDPFNFDDILSSFDFDGNASSPEGEKTFPDAQLAGDELAGDKAFDDMLAGDTGDEKLFSEEPSAPSDDSFDFEPLEPSEPLDVPMDFDDENALGQAADDIDNTEELSLFSENRDGAQDAAQESAPTELPAAEQESALSDLETHTSPDAAEEQPLDIKPVLEADIAALAAADEDASTPLQEVDNWEQAGFSLEDDPLKSDITEIVDNQFNLPDSFKDFSTDANARMFDSVIAKSTDSSEDADSLAITDDDYFAFLNKLESFPLNVQLKIQNYIASGDDSPENKMDFIRFVLGKNSLKKVVNKLETLVGERIPIPRGFQRRSVEEYERELHSVRYWLTHRVLPVAVMSAIALILIFCVSLLSWQFIYKPITAESLYKTGYTYLEEGQYESAIGKFNQAGEYKRKKKWYFAYARAFREKKQFTAAEWMYSKILYDFNNDKQGGVEYADMLSTDLRNYEKAEAVLRRRVLDHHVNDKDGMLALGDVFMNWADEVPEKYNDAVKIYSRLIELYGESDVFLLRMMQYFIRTDNLAEVLRLKYHFGSRITKIEPVRLTELSGYLLEKRYNPKPLDSEKLRTQIDDVRMLLEKAVQADGSIPEAYYNLGRFFIYNNKQDGAIENLAKSISLFKTVSHMPARRLVRHVDAMRLLGEQLTSQKKYLDAQALYADAISRYRNYTAFKPLPPHRKIGKLYADYADIDYFISHNFDSALENYQNAVKELYNTPSIHYRIGYIQYSKENYQQAIASMSRAYAEKARDKNVLYGFGNAFFKRGDYFAAMAAYEELLSLLNAQHSRKERALSNTRPDDAAFIELYMHTANNLGATLGRISERTGDSKKNARALALYAEASRAWDALTRNPQTMVRAKSVGLAYLNTKNMLNRNSSYESEIYTDIPMILDNERALEQKEDK